MDYFPVYDFRPPFCTLARRNCENVRPSRLQHAGSFAECFFQPGHVLEHFRGNDEIKRAIPKGERRYVFADCPIPLCPIASLVVKGPDVSPPCGKNVSQGGMRIEFEHVQFRKSVSVPAPNFFRQQLVTLVRGTEQARAGFRGTVIWLDEDRHPLTTLATA